MKDSPKELLEALNLKDLSIEEQEELLLDLNDLVYKGAMMRLLEAMDPDTRTAFDVLLDSDPAEEKIQDFLEQNVPGADQAIRDTIEDLRGDILAATGASQD
jgi:hypothetical protein